MRVIAGSLGGRMFDAPKGLRTHPMSDKARGALFNTLGDVSSLTVLDAFTGSGALSFEAISRGARSAIAVDIDKGTITAVVKSAEDLGISSSIKAIRANVSSWSDNNPGVQYDLVFCDPPYDGLQTSLLQKLTRHVKDGGLMVLSWPRSLEIPALSGLAHIKTQNYGDATLAFYRKIS